MHKRYKVSTLMHICTFCLRESNFLIFKLGFILLLENIEESFYWLSIWFTLNFFFWLLRKFCSKNICAIKEASFLFDPIKLDEIRSTGKKTKRKGEKKTKIAKRRTKENERERKKTSEREHKKERKNINKIKTKDKQTKARKRKKYKEKRKIKNELKKTKRFSGLFIQP